MLIRRANERGHADHGWLDTYHTFSFADYWDEKWMGFRSLRVINEDRIAPGKGFDLHGHRDMEIVTYVMKGALRHVDSMGNNEVLKAGEVQVMTAGTGIRHMEMNASQTEECHLYQIWIQPDRHGHTPRYEQKPLTALPSFPLSSRAERSGVEGSIDSKVLIASPSGRDGSLQINQDAEIWLWRLGEGLSPEALAKGEEKATIEVPEGKACWMQVVGGVVEIGKEKLTTSDASGIKETKDLLAKASAELLFFIL